MTITPSALLYLPIISTGTEPGVWGNEVNNGLTQYVDVAVAGTLTLAGDGPITLTNTSGDSSNTNLSATSAQYAIIRVTGALTTTKVITAPSLGYGSVPYSKTYIIDNQASGGSVTIKASGQTGVTVPAGTKAHVIFNGTDYVAAESYLPTATITTATITTATISGGTIGGVAITTGTINNTPIGGTTPNTGAFTTLSTTGTVTFGGTGAITLPVGTTAQEPGTPSTGMLRFNTTLSQFEGYNGAGWGGIGGASASNAIYVNNQTIASSYTFASGTSGSSTGPITLAAGVSITLPSDARWVIL